MANWTRPSARDPWKVRAATRGDAAGGVWGRVRSLRSGRKSSRRCSALCRLFFVLELQACAFPGSFGAGVRTDQRHSQKGASAIWFGKLLHPLLTVRDCPLRWAEGQGVLTIGCSGITTISTCCHMRCVKSCRRRLDHVQTDR